LTECEVRIRIYWLNRRPFAFAKYCCVLWLQTHLHRVTCSFISVQNIHKYQQQSKECATLTIQTLTNKFYSHLLEDMNIFHKNEANPA
jgi:hypothetical protein